MIRKLISNLVLTGVFQLLVLTVDAQVGGVEINGPVSVALNEEVEYKITFRNNKGHFVTAPFADSYTWSATIGNNMTLPFFFLSQSEYSMKIKWTRSGLQELVYIIYTNDDPNFWYTDVTVHLKVFVKDPNQPMITVSNNGIIPVGGGVSLSTPNVVYDSYVWQNAYGADISGANASIFTTNQPGGYRLKATKGGSTYISDVKTVFKYADVVNKNYIVNNTIRKEGVLNLMDVNSLAVEDNNSTIQYFDGLGRPIQTVRKQASPDKQDIVQPLSYDMFGREDKKYLPAILGDDGLFKVNFAKDKGVIDAEREYQSGEHYAFYQNALNIRHDSRPFSTTLFEKSPLNRPVKVFGSGEDWFTNNRYTEYKGLTNTYGIESDKERIIVWTINSVGMPVRNPGAFNDYTGYFRERSLSVKSVIDEEGIETREYTTLEGRMILKKTQSIKGSPELNNSGHWAQTYYIYDDFNDLKFVLQPELVKKIIQNNTYNPTDSDLNAMAFRYKYDSRKRLIEKKIPGSGWQYFAYDKRDRQILSQDGNQRSKNEWSFNKYDALNRVVVTGIYRPGATISRDDMQTQVNNNGVQNAITPATPDLVLTGTDIVSSSYDGHSIYRATNSITLTSGFQFSSAGGSTFEASIGESSPVSDGVFPFTNIELLTLTYYDNYDNCSFSKNTAYDSSPELPKTENLRGLITGTSVRVLETNQWLHTKNYYDKKYRLIESISNNYAGGMDRTSMQYNFNGQILQKISTPSGYNGKMVNESFTYDHTGRLLNHYHTIDDESSILLSSQVYNEVGQLIEKKLHNNLQSIKYKYNIRGWMTAINDPDNLGSGLFGMKLNYNKPEVGDNKSYNGNISEMIWNKAGENKKNSFSYNYDALNRLTLASYKAANVSGIWDTDIDQYKEEITSYDLNGNILGLNRWGNISGSPQQIDRLTYSYADGNSLQKLEDNGTAYGFNNGSNDNVEYTYDANGNLLTDKNKGITNTGYNLLNLPQKVELGNNWISYIYDATGRKLRKTTSYTNEVRDYANGVELLNNSFDLLHTGEGRWTTGQGYEYFLKDHLGNTRAMFGINSNGQVDLKDKIDYYPFGMVLPNNGSNSNGNNYLYNGKELQEELGQLDYGARFYDPVIGRWTRTDNKAELYFNHSTYVYALNRPINAIDPDGNVVIFINGNHFGTGATGYEGWRKRKHSNYNFQGSNSYWNENGLSFDGAVMKQLGDDKAIYRDGSGGGYMGLDDFGSLFAWGRVSNGYSQGAVDAETIIANLARDKTTGEIVETIKIVTHSMGGAYGKGYVRALKKYINTLPKEQQAQIKITLVADFDPFQAGSLDADPNIYTQQFSHVNKRGRKSSDKFGWLANDIQGGVDDYYEDKREAAHSISTFFNDIRKLHEGTYKWNGYEWLMQ